VHACILKPVKKADVNMLLISAMALAQPPGFEVASIRLAPTQGPFSSAEPFFCPFGCFNTGRMKVDGARMDIAFMPLDELIRRAYRIRPDQLVVPERMSVQRFDILATIPEGAARVQVPEMLQTLLAERFKLTAHRETREQSVYELRVDRGGPNLKGSTEAVPAGDPTDKTLNSPQGPIQARQIDGGLMVVGWSLGSDANGSHYAWQQPTRNGVAGSNDAVARGRAHPIHGSPCDRQDKAQGRLSGGAF
jgi:uncharacterized protein (TIGR03435 family)